jgi:hypothetical protein
MRALQLVKARVALEDTADPTNVLLMLPNEFVVDGIKFTRKLPGQRVNNYEAAEENGFKLALRVLSYPESSPTLPHVVLLMRKYNKHGFDVLKNEQHRRLSIPIEQFRRRDVDKFLHERLPHVVNARVALEGPRVIESLADVPNRFACDGIQFVQNHQHGSSTLSYWSNKFDLSIFAAPLSNPRWLYVITHEVSETNLRVSLPCSADDLFKLITRVVAETRAIIESKRVQSRVSLEEPTYHAIEDLPEKLVLDDKEFRATHSYPIDPSSAVAPYVYAPKGKPIIVRITRSGNVYINAVTYHSAIKFPVRGTELITELSKIVNAYSEAFKQ